MLDDIYQLSLIFPKDEKFSLTDQIRRSSRSIGAQIAEAWGKRRYPKHFISKLTDAERYETEHWIRIAQGCKYIDNSTADKFLSRLVSIGKRLNGMMNKAHLFSLPNHSVKEPGTSFYETIVDEETPGDSRS